MSLFFGHSGLAWLARRKLRGTLRKTGRRLKTWKGAILTLLGVGLFAMWIGSITLSTLSGGRGPIGLEELVPKVQMAALILVLLNLASAFQHRGLFLPADEIERLFSAPLRRGDLVRYRILATCGRSLFGALIIALATVSRMPRPLFAFLGIFVAVMTIPLLHQLAAILAGGLEHRLAARIRFLARLAFVVGIFLGAILLMLLVTGNGLQDLPGVRTLFEDRLTDETDLFAHPAVRGLLLPFLPWARMITAPTAAQFLPWWGASVAGWFVLFEFTARLPLDYRELSLQTSSDVAAKIRRMRRGGGAAAGKVTPGTVGWRVPWWFGRGPGGAVAWRKTASILRKARGTLWTSTIILALVTIFSTLIGSDSEGRWGALLAPVLISLLGTFYLCSGLRFDFREDLDRMEVIKTWPIPPLRLFTAMLLPEVVLVSLLLVAAVLLRAGIARVWDPALLALVSLQPLVVLAWVGLDNAVFLFLPVRFTPGQDGALQNAGRGMLMMLTRLVALAVIAAVGGGTAAAVWFASTRLFGLEPDAAFVPTVIGLWGAVLLVDLGVLKVGGIMLRRFDVARDRG